MGDKTSIEWTRGDDDTRGATWNPTTGCDRVSPGCDNCYALGMAKRLKAMGQPDYQTDGDPKTSGPGFGLAMHPHRLDQPLRWTRPRFIFVNSMSDLFHKDVTDEFLAKVFAVMALAPHHTFQVLTKRHARMRALLSSGDWQQQMWEQWQTIDLPGTDQREGADYPPWPLPNVWMGVSVENQQWADIRIPVLLETPAAVRWLSMEPLLGPVDLFGPVDQYGGRPKLTYWLDGRPHWVDDVGSNPKTSSMATGPKIDWVVAGGESGPGARPMHPQWARSLRDQCVDAGVPFFMKQTGSVLASEWGLKGKGHVAAEWPEPFPQEMPTALEVSR